MKNSRDKIKFNFLFRDEGNYKTFSYEILNNSNNLDVSDIEKKIRSKLIDSEFFYPKKLGIKKFSFLDSEFDNSWYEFENVEKVSITEDYANIDKYRNIEELFN